MNTNQAIFMTNTFAQANPEAHIRLWGMFENEVPLSKRSGVFGIENVAYINFLRARKEPVFMKFFQDSVESRQ